MDLNNEAPYPTLAIGYLTTPLIEAGYEVTVFSPLARGMTPLRRDVEEGVLDYLAMRAQFADGPMMAWANELLFKLYHGISFRATRELKRSFKNLLAETRFDAILVSSYLQYHRLLVEMARQAKTSGIPLLLGGPYFNQKAVTEQWIDMEGVTAIFGGEADFVLSELVDDLINRRDLKRHPGIFQREVTVLGQAKDPVSLPDSLPIPNFDHFPWENHPHRILPIMTGRGCSWGHCLFCSDVTTASTRTFRTRSLDAVLNELRVQSENYWCKNFIFVDNKLNSDLRIWYGIIRHFQEVVPGGRWVAIVHVDGRGDNGLDADTLSAAHESGLRRISFGLESGSQHLNRLMRKGTSIQRMSEFVKNACDAGISVRTTCMLGYPGETAADVEATIALLEEHYRYIDRVKLSKFKAIPGTAIQNRLDTQPGKYPSVTKLEWDFKLARAKLRHRPPHRKDYRRSMARLLKIVHRINQKKLADDAQQFNGLM